MNRKQRREYEKEKEKNIELLTRLRADSLIDRDRWWIKKLIKKKNEETEMRRNRFKYGNDNPVSTGAYNKQYTDIDMNEYAGMEVNRVLNEILGEV